MKILLIDDHQLFSEGLSCLLENKPNNAAILHVNGKTDALKLLAKTNFDLCICDFYMPEASGLNTLKEIKNTYPSIPLLMVSSCTNANEIKSCMDSGAMGFVSKASNSTEIIRAVNTLLQGSCYLSTGIRQILRHHEKKSSQLHITQKQQETLRYLSQGLNNREIAAEMMISEVTVKTHVSDLLATFEAKNRTECVYKARSLGIVQQLS